MFSGQAPASLEQLAARAAPSVSVLPDCWVLKIGGQSIMDRGKQAVSPILEELVQARDDGVPYILGTGGGHGKGFGGGVGPQK